MTDIWSCSPPSLDGALTEAEERELEGHLAACPDCRAVGAQLSAHQEAFPELEEAGTAPEGFARGVMDRIRASEAPKIIPLFKRPQVRALAGLAACLVLVVGLYGASRPRNLDETVKMDMAVRSFSQDAQAESEENPQINAAPADPELAAAPRSPPTPPRRRMRPLERWEWLPIPQRTAWRAASGNLSQIWPTRRPS